MQSVLKFCEFFISFLFTLQQGLWIVESQTVLKRSDIKECLPYLYLRRRDTLLAGSVALV